MLTFNYLIDMEIGKMTISEAYPHLKSIANVYGLNLNRVKEFKFARLMLANLYNRELC
jgi:hypothetical protein